MCANITTSGGSTWRDSLSKRLLLDNGAYHIKYSNASSTDPKPQLMYNAVGKDKKGKGSQVYIGNKLWDELEGGRSGVQVTYPVIRGLLHDSDIETVIWKQIFSKFKKLEERSSCLALTLPPVLPDLVQHRVAELAFEDFEFDGLLMASTHSMIREAAMQEHQQEIGDICQLVVDSGFSFTYAVPFFNGRPLKYAATRLDVGGKLLTNLLNETLSYKEVNLQGETFLVNDIKESLCYVSTDFQSDLDICCLQKINPLTKEYVLPDYKGVKKGYVRDPIQQQYPQEAPKHDDDEPEAKRSQAVKVGNERFQVPEVLFRPSDIGINEAGIPEMLQ